MAKFEEYWQQISGSQNFQDLEDDKKEKVRQHLFDTYIQKSQSYQGLPQSQRIQVKKHFDDLTKIQPEGLGEHIAKVGKKAMASAAPVIEKGKEIVKAVPGALKTASREVAIAGEFAKQTAPLPVRAGYEGMRKVSEGISKGAQALGEKIEPTEEEIAQHVQKTGEMTNFDVARMVASGSVKTAGEFLAGAVPTDPVQMDIYPLLDGLFKAAGTTFLGRELHLPGWKPKTGLSKAAVSLGDDFDKIITKRRIENNVRAMDGPPKPLEVLAREEERVKTKSDIDSYEEWLKNADIASARGGEPVGDLHPDNKVNVSQLRDAAKERLRRLENKPVRVESLGRAEDEVKGYFRRQIDKQKVYMMPPASEALPERDLLTGRQEPAGLLESGVKRGEETSLPARPGQTQTGTGAPGQPGVSPTGEADLPAVFPGPKDPSLRRITQEPEYGKMAQRAYEVVARHAREKGVKPSNDFAQDLFSELHDALGEVRMAPANKRAEVIARVSKQYPSIESDFLALKDQLYSDKTEPYFDKYVKGRPDLALQPQDFSPGIKGYKEFISQSFARRLPGETKQTVDRLSGTLLSALRDENWINPKNPRSLDQSMMGMLDKMVEQTAKDSKPTYTVPDSLAKLREAAGFPPDNAMDNQARSLWNIVSDLGKNLGEKGGVGGEIDPVKKARVEENIKELVDRAMSLGYETSQDIMVYAAKNAPAEVRDAIRKNLAPTLSPFDTHAYKEIEAAKAGNPVAKKSLMDAAMRDYLKEKYEWAKGVRKRRSVSKIIGQFKDGDEALLRLKNDLFMHDYYRKFTPEEDGAMRWMLENKAPSLDALKHFMPEDQAQRMLKLYKNPTENMKAALPATKVMEDEYHALMSEFYDSLGYRENHVTRRWKQPKEYLGWEGRVLGDRPNFTKGAKLLSQADGIDAGHEPVSFSMKDDLRASNDVRTNLLSRLHSLRKIAATVDHEGRPSIILENPGGQSTKAGIAFATGKAPNSWLRYQGVPLLRDLAINPDYKPAIDYVMQSRFKWMPIEMYEHIGSFSKASILGYSLFHPASLTEMLLGGISYRDVFTFNMNKNVFAKLGRNFAKAATADLEGPLNWKDPVKSINALYNSFKSGHAALANRGLALDMAEHGFKLGAIDDVNYNILSKTLTKYEGWLKAREASMPKGKAAFKEAREMVSGIREAGDLLQKFMWDYQRPLFSMHLYESHLADNIKKFNLEAAEGKKIPIDQIKFQTSNFISKMVGGISMGALLVTPRAQQFLQWSMMAPDWTIGRVLMPVSALTKGPEGRQARKLMLRMGVSYFVFGNLLNYHNSEKNLGKGRFMWENDPGHEMEIVFRKDKTGRTSYIQVSKAFTEIYDDLDHPMKTAAYKANPMIHAGVKLMNWAMSGSFKSTLKTEGPLDTARDLFVPRTFSGMNAYGTFPIHKGISRAQVMDMFAEYHKTGNPKLLDQAMRYGMESGFDVSALARAAKARYGGQIRRKEREDLLR